MPKAKVFESVPKAKVFEARAHGPDESRDALTGLLDRAAFARHLADVLLESRRQQTSCALLVVDLDRFKEVNGAFGHSAGDQLLREVARRYRSALPDSDVLARLGGDEFGAVVARVRDLAEAIGVARTLLRATEDPLTLHRHALHVAASIGIALGPEHGRDAETLLRHADVAMYAAKRSGTGYAVYSPAEDPYSASMLGLAADLRRAVEREELFLQYQPIVDMRTGQCLRVEALLRWQHPRRGLLPPEQFVPIAEGSGFVKPLGLWVLARALRDCAAWRAADLGLGVAVNLSPRHLRDDDVTSAVGELLATTRVPADQLTVEISESAIASELTVFRENLARLRGLGARLAIDDFGTAYSSLAAIRRLAIDEIKIDNSFVLSSTTDATSAVIVRLMIELAHSLGLAVVAEGIEDGHAWDLFAAMGCDAAQGYHVGRSMRADELGPWLEDRRAVAATRNSQKQRAAAAILASLTPREREVLRLMGQGLENEAIAARLNVTLVTVRGYVQKVLEKLEAHSRLEAVVRAQKSGALELLEGE